MSRNVPLIALAEDDTRLAEILQKQIELAGMEVIAFNSGYDVIQGFQEELANVLLLDISLPDIDGFEVLKRLQELKIEIPVIFLTAFSDEYYKIKGFDIGADDFVTKPFSFTELIARIKAVLKRSEYSRFDGKLSHNVALSDCDFEFCGAIVRPSSMTIDFRNGQTAEIGRKELGVIKHLAANEDIILSRQNLVHNIWGRYANMKSRSLDQYMVKIRQIWSSHGGDASGLRTLHGIGYMYTTRKSVPDMTRREYADTFDVML